MTLESAILWVKTRSATGARLSRPRRGKNGKGRATTQKARRGGGESLCAKSQLGLRSGAGQTCVTGCTKFLVKSEQLIAKVRTSSVKLSDYIINISRSAKVRYFGEVFG